MSLYHAHVRIHDHVCIYDARHSVASGLEFMDIVHAGYGTGNLYDLLFDVFRKRCLQEFIETWHRHLHGHYNDGYADAA